MRKVELILKPVSYDCNLSCGYCFYKKTSRLYPGRSHLMRENVLEKLICECMTYSDGGPCIFCWQGGEPLLAGISFFQKVVEFQKEYGRPGQIVSNSVQTNATLLNTEWIRFFKKYNFFIGVSLDGPPQVHNHYRQYASGRGSFEEVVAGINLLAEGGVDFNILSTIGKETAYSPQEIYKYFLSRGLYYLQFIPAVDRKNQQVADFSITPAQYGNFLCRLFDIWWNHGNPFASIRLFDNILEILLGQESNSCAFKDHCSEYLVAEFNGDIYPCDFFVNKEWKLGNISKVSIEKLFQKARLRFGNLKKIVSSDCKNCQWNFICHNGCPWFRWVRNARVEEKDYLCDSYRQFFPYAIKRLEKLRDSILFRTSESKRF